MADALHIDDPRAERLARELSERTGESVAEAVVHALEERLERKPMRRRPRTDVEREEQRAAVMQIIEDIHKLPVLDPRSPDELVGYDDDGLPG